MANMSINALFTRLTLVLAMLVLLGGCNDRDEDGPLLFQMGGAIQGAALNLSRDVSTLAGTAGVFDSGDGTGAEAKFSKPFSITTDGINLYVADSFNSTVRQIVIKTGVVTTLAGIAGKAGSIDGQGRSAEFDYPADITTDGSNLYVTDYFNGTVRQIEIDTRMVTTLAGTAGVFGSADGTGAAAQFNHPFGITVVADKLYVADTDNHTIREISISTGEVTTLAGTASRLGVALVDGVGTAARFNRPTGITTDGEYLYVSGVSFHTIRQIDIATRVVTTLAGSGTVGWADGIGRAAQFSTPNGLTTDGVNLYVADFSNAAIRKMVISSKEVTTIAGNPTLAGSDDGAGNVAKFWGPGGLTSDGRSLFVTDTNNATIRQIK